MSLDKDKPKVSRTNLQEGNKDKANNEFFHFVSESTVGPGFSGHDKNFITIRNGRASEGEKSLCSINSIPLQNEEAFNKAWVDTREKMMHQRLENIEHCRERDLAIHKELNAAFEKQMQLHMRERNKAEMELELKTIECEEQNKKTEGLENELKDVTKKLVEKEHALSQTLGEIKKIDETSSKKDEEMEMMALELDDLKKKVKEKDGILHQAFAEIQKRKAVKKEKSLEAEKQKLSDEIGKLREQLKKEKRKNLEFAEFMSSTKEKFVEQTNKLAKAEEDKKHLHNKLAMTSKFNKQLNARIEALNNYIDWTLEVDLNVCSTDFFPFDESKLRKLSFSDSDEGVSYMPRMVKIDRILLDKVQPVGIRKQNEIDVFVRLIESNLVKDGVLLRLDINWDIMTLVRAGIAGWQWMLSNPEDETEEIATLRKNRRINWVMGVNTSNHKQVKSVAMLKFGLGVKFFGSHLSRKIEDYPKLIKHNAKVWIISREFINVKPSPSFQMRYSERFWNRAKKSPESDSFQARVMSSTTPRNVRKSAEFSNITRRLSGEKDTKWRQLSLERRLSSSPVIKRNNDNFSSLQNLQRLRSKDMDTENSSPIRFKRRTNMGDFRSLRNDDSLVSNESEDDAEESYFL